MRRPERALKNKETIHAMLEQCSVGRIATVNQRGFPAIKPVNFLFWKEKIYLHSSRKGEKMRDVRRGSPVCFEIDEPIAYVNARGSACSGSYYYRSILIKGKAVLVNHQEEKMKVLERLMEKYQPEGGYGEISKEILRKTAIIEISIQKITGKENLG